MWLNIAHRVLLVGFLVSLAGCSATKPATVPNVVGHQLQRAEHEIQKAHLKYRVEIPAGSSRRSSSGRVVVSQRPRAGRHIKRGGTVVLVSPG